MYCWWSSRKTLTPVYLVADQVWCPTISNMVTGGCKSRKWIFLGIPGEYKQGGWCSWFTLSNTVSEWALWTNGEMHDKYLPSPCRPKQHKNRVITVRWHTISNFTFWSIGKFLCLFTFRIVFVVDNAKSSGGSAKEGRGVGDRCHPWSL